MKVKVAEVLKHNYFVNSEFLLKENLFFYFFFVTCWKFSDNLNHPLKMKKIKTTKILPAAIRIHH